MSKCVTLGAKVKNAQICVCGWNWMCWWIKGLILNVYRSRTKEIGFRSGENESYRIVDPVHLFRLQGKFICKFMLLNWIRYVLFVIELQ